MLKINDVVYNKRYNTIGIVLDIFDMGEARTDADGVVYLSDLKIIKSKEDYFKMIRIMGCNVAPSTEKRILNELLVIHDVEKL